MKQSHPEWRPASNKLTTGENMKRISIFAIPLLFSASLAHVGVAQSPAGAPTNADASTQTKQDKKEAKAKAKPPIRASTGKKTTTSQDAAYSLAARKGSPEPRPTTPPK
jgi:hypothetical protein